MQLVSLSSLEPVSKLTHTAVTVAIDYLSAGGTAPTESVGASVSQLLKRTFDEIEKLGRVCQHDIG